MAEQEKNPSQEQAKTVEWEFPGERSENVKLAWSYGRLEICSVPPVDIESPEEGF